MVIVEHRRHWAPSKEECERMGRRQLTTKRIPPLPESRRSGRGRKSYKKVSRFGHATDKHAPTTHIDLLQQLDKIAACAYGNGMLPVAYRAVVYLVA